MRFSIIAALPVTALFACTGAGASDRDSLIAKCERSAGRVASSPEQASMMCACTADGLIAEGLSSIDMMTGDRGSEIARQCAIGAGMTPAG